MIKKMTSLLEVNGNDSLGTAVLKGAVKGYVKGTLAAGLGLGVLAVGLMLISKEEESEEGEEIEFELDDVVPDDERIERFRESLKTT